MNSRRTLLTLLTLLITVFTVGLASAQDNAPRSLPADMMINEGFEPNANYWTKINAVGDKVKCGGLGATASNCAFMFKGGVGENTTIQQIYKPGVNASGAQYIYLNVNVRPLNAGIKIKFFVTVKFKGGAAPMKKAFVYVSEEAQDNYSAVEFITNTFNPANVKSVVIGATNRSTSGKAYIDQFYVGAYDE